jgi:hypothetical protein
MTKHFHLLLSTPQSNLDTIMREFMGSTTRIINTKAKRSGHLYGGRYFWSIIKSPLYFAHAYKYVYRNPVKAGICSKVEEFAFSTIGMFPAPMSVNFKIDPASESIGQLVVKDPFEQISWLNRAYSNIESEAISKALHKKTFRLPLDRISRKRHRIAMEI